MELKNEANTLLGFKKQERDDYITKTNQQKYYYNYYVW